MCFYKRIIWGCGCPRGTILDRPCQYRGTPQCQIRHLLDRVRVSRPCRVHQALGTSSRRTGPRRRTQRSGGLILRRQSHPSSGSSSVSGSTGSGSATSSPIRAATGAATNGITNGLPTNGLNGTAHTPPNRSAPRTPSSNNNIANTNSTRNGTSSTPSTPSVTNTPTTASTSSGTASSPMVHSADNSPLAAMTANRRGGAAANPLVNGNPNPRATAYFNSVADDSGSESD